MAHVVNRAFTFFNHVLTDPLPPFRSDTPLIEYGNITMSPIFFSIASFSYVMLINYLSATPERIQWFAKTYKLPNWVPIVHNIFLAGYSTISFSMCLPLTAGNFFSGLINGGVDGFFDQWCDVSGEIWLEQGLSKLLYIFYLSKFYEFFDTIIILAKGRKPDYLQVFHHGGVTFCCIFLVRSRHPGSWAPMTFNLGIHSIMYTYYLLTAAKINILPKFFKQLLTSLQILQFVCVSSWLLSYLVIQRNGKPCAHTDSHIFSTFFAVWYLGYLVVLFSRFYKRSYSSNKKALNETVKIPSGTHSEYEKKKLGNRN